LHFFAFFATAQINSNERVVGATTSALLCSIMGTRYAKTRKVMPAGKFLILKGLHAYPEQNIQPAFLFPLLLAGLLAAAGLGALAYHAQKAYEWSP
jgi:hypothetical protein